MFFFCTLGFEIRFSAQRPVSGHRLQTSSVPLKISTFCHFSLFFHSSLGFVFSDTGLPYQEFDSRKLTFHRSHRTSSNKFVAPAVQQKKCSAWRGQFSSNTNFRVGGIDLCKSKHFYSRFYH